MPERPRLHLDFNSPCTPPPIYSPHFSTSPGSPTSPPSSSYSSIKTPTRRSSTSSTSSTESSSSYSSPKTPSTPKIIMGAMVFTPEPRSKVGINGEDTEDEECDVGEMSLEVPGIVLTEPPRQPTPRLPSPPPKQVVLLAPCSLPIPSSSSFCETKEIKLSYSSKINYGYDHDYGNNEKPKFLNTILKFLGSYNNNTFPSSNQLQQLQQQQQQQFQKRNKRSQIKMILLLCILILGSWHIWSNLGLTLGLVEETSLIL
ncbi:uncharacterized protein I206_101870 [Kwoniella pini CBS 10737]|uniref:Uncharacterized protein n=1 Tax=Kwoniella pini CBS 10737 TaxID=1296096 RepID=A0A1B9HVH2_9TREE|nr:uncharacterized protein I206_07039 [Kwoniella pini CBS 10737]OCF47261.1 hypothetical protein I206_07039 [Kwoniella pini CBS 10737]